MSELLLASGSPRRAELLRQIGVQFVVAPVPIDESPLSGECAQHYVLRMAVEKSQAAVRCFGSGAILTADTTVALDGEILGKPGSQDEARALLARLSGRRHQVLSAVCLTAAGRSESRFSATTVTFAALSESVIERYLRCGESMDKAGGYAIQGAAAAFVEAIEGSYSGVVGLPLQATCQLLDAFAIPYWSRLS